MKRTKYIFTVDDVDVLTVYLHGDHDPEFVQLQRSLLANKFDVPESQVGAERIIAHEGPLDDEHDLERP